MRVRKNITPPVCNWFNGTSDMLQTNARGKPTEKKAIAAGKQVWQFGEQGGQTVKRRASGAFFSQGLILFTVAENLFAAGTRRVY